MKSTNCNNGDISHIGGYLLGIGAIQL